MEMGGAMIAVMAVVMLVMMGGMAWGIIVAVRRRITRRRDADHH